MNEYLGGADGGRRFGSPYFTDIFANEERRKKYHDSPLSPRGLSQATAMAKKKHEFVNTCELVVVSPLTRALQTFHIGLLPHFAQSGGVPVIALPEAAERLYLISDVGRGVSQLQDEYDYVDFETGFSAHHEPECWWYRPDEYDYDNYVEWRPVDCGQQYACPSEPLEVFHRRMRRLHEWLDRRPERHIAVVCHHGVIDAFLDCDFYNCQYRSVDFASLWPQLTGRPEFRS